MNTLRFSICPQLIVSLSLFCFVLSFTRLPAQSCPSSTLVHQGVDVFTVSYNMHNGKYHTNVAWHDEARCPEEAGDAEVVYRKPAYDGGGPGDLPMFLSDDTRPSGVCNPYQFLSEIIADRDATYWVDQSGLVAMPDHPLIVTPGLGENDAPKLILLSASVHGIDGGPRVELAQDDDYVYALPPNSGSGRGRLLLRVRKSDGETDTLLTVNGNAHDLQADGRSVYWCEAGNLWRYRLYDGALDKISTGVTGYYAEGRRPAGGEFRGPTYFVFVGRGPQVMRYDSITDSSKSIYMNPDWNVLVYNLATTSDTLCFFEKRSFSSPIPDLFENIKQYTVAAGRDGCSPAVVCSSWSSLPGTVDNHSLTSDGRSFFWQHIDQVKMMTIIAACSGGMISARGDANRDGFVDIEDYESLARYLYERGERPMCDDAADVNADGELDSADLVLLLNIIFGDVQPRTSAPVCDERDVDIRR